MISFPGDVPGKLAFQTVTAFLEENGSSMEQVIFNVFKDSDREIYEKLLK